MDAYCVSWSRNELLYSIENEQATVTCKNPGESLKHNNEWKKVSHRRPHTVWGYFSQSSRPSQINNVLVKHFHKYAKNVSKRAREC